jgi:hypothetical protein
VAADRSLAEIDEPEGTFWAMENVLIMLMLAVSEAYSVDDVSLRDLPFLHLSSTLSSQCSAHVPTTLMIKPDPLGP